MKSNKLLTAVMAAFITLVGAGCTEEYTDTSAPTTTVDGAPTPPPTGDAEAAWPKIDGQPLPYGVAEGGPLTGEVRNLGADEAPWTDNPGSDVLNRAHQEPLFASELAQEFGGDAARQVSFWGLDGLQEDGKWTEAGNSFLKLLDVEILERFQGVGELPNGNIRVVLANSERDAVRLTFKPGELTDVGELALFTTECGMVAVDVRGNLYIPCDCGRFTVKRPPAKPTCPDGTPIPSEGCGGKHAAARPPQDPVGTDPRTGDTVPPADNGDPGNGDSGVGAPGQGVEVPTQDTGSSPVISSDQGGNTQTQDPDAPQTT